MTRADVIRMAREAGLCSWAVVPEAEAKKTGASCRTGSSRRARGVCKVAGSNLVQNARRLRRRNPRKE